MESSEKVMGQVRAEMGIAFVRRLVALSVLGLALSAFAIAPASAQTLGSWTLDCQGQGGGSVSWNWLLNGAPISNAGGSATCGGMMTITGTSVPPATANGLSISLIVSAGNKADSKSVTKSFSPGSSFTAQLKGSATDSGWAEFCYPDSRTCVRIHFHYHEAASFSLDA